MMSRTAPYFPSACYRFGMRFNRMSVLTLWAAMVAERLGFGHDEALTLGWLVAGLSRLARHPRFYTQQP